MTIKGLFFSADWCASCNTAKPIIENLIKDGYDIEIIDCEKNPELPKEYNILSLPVLVILRDGKYSNRLIGTFDKKQYKKALDFQNTL